MAGNLKNLKHSALNALAAVMFGILAAAIDLVMGRPNPDWSTIIAVAVSAYILADKQGWLMPAGGKRPRTSRISDYAAASLYAALLALYIVGAGDYKTPPMPPLFLVVVLAVVCYTLRIGMVISIGAAALYALCAISAQPDGPVWRSVVAVCTFPMAAMLAGVLKERLEARVHAISDRTEEMSALLDMSQMMDSAVDLDTTLNLILLNVQHMTNCQVCAVYLKNAREDVLDLRVASGPRHRLDLAPAIVASDACFEQWNIDETAQPLGTVAAFYAPNAESIRAASPGSRLFDLDRRAESFACVPLTSLDGLLGMLYVGYDGPCGLDEHSIQRLENLAVRAASSLQRAVVQEGFESLAYNDVMTGLDNFRRFEHDLIEETHRAERYDRVLSVILLDIDLFKNFNDTLGHQAGDALLDQLATVLRDSLRNVDKPARYGGEEFVVICPETGKDEAKIIAERIRRNVEQTAFTLLGCDPDTRHNFESREIAHVTVSVGYATFSADARSPRDLVKCADEALYAAKHAGRNTVRGYEEISSQLVAAHVG